MAGKRAFHKADWSRVFGQGSRRTKTPWRAGLYARVSTQDQQILPLQTRAKRVTTGLAAERNRFVAAISDEVLIPYAAPGSKTEALALDLLGSGKRVYTFSDRPSPSSKDWEPARALMSPGATALAFMDP